MKIRETFCFLTLGLIISFSSFAQVGINNANPESTAILDLTDHKRGLLVPRMTSQRRMEILNEVGMPAQGLLVYDTDDDMFYYYNPDNNDGDNGGGDQNWQALAPLLFKDLRNNSIVNDHSETVYLRTLETHESVKDIIFFENTPGTYDEDNAPKLYVDGQLTVGADERAPSVNGIHVEGVSDFDNDVLIAGRVGEYTDFGSSAVSYQTTFIGYGTTPLGGIMMWSGNPDALPPGWKLCNGSGSFTNEMGDLLTIPDLRNRFIVGTGDLYRTGDKGGANNVTLTVNQMPSHNHNLNDPGHDHKYKDDYNADEKSDDANDRTVGSNDKETRQRTTVDSKTGITLDNSGGGQSHENRPPYYALAYIIRVQ